MRGEALTGRGGGRIRVQNFAWGGEDSLFPRKTGAAAALYFRKTFTRVA
jgi:hypothetical protein